MALASSDIGVYLNQWVKTATGGKVVFERALLTNRLRAHCSECNCTMTCDCPESVEKIDYALQEFVKLHSHRGGHQDTETELKAKIKQLEAEKWSENAKKQSEEKLQAQIAKYKAEAEKMKDALGAKAAQQAQAQQAQLIWTAEQVVAMRNWKPAPGQEVDVNAYGNSYGNTAGSGWVFPNGTVIVPNAGPFDKPQPIFTPQYLYPSPPPAPEPKPEPPKESPKPLPKPKGRKFR